MKERTRLSNHDRLAVMIIVENILANPRQEVLTRYETELLAKISYRIADSMLRVRTSYKKPI